MDQHQRSDATPDASSTARDRLLISTCWRSSKRHASYKKKNIFFFLFPKTQLVEKAAVFVGEAMDNKQYMTSRNVPWPSDAPLERHRQA